MAKAAAYRYSVEQYRSVRELCRVGARQPVIKALWPSFPDALLRAMWIEEQGRKPPPGPLPHDVGYYLSHNQRRLHASFFLQTFNQLRAAGIQSDTDALLGAYQKYTQVFAEEGQDKLMPFDRAWFIYREYMSSKSICMVKCANCGISYIHDRHELVSDRNCPVRRAVPDYEQFVAYRKKKPFTRTQRQSVDGLKIALAGDASALPTPSRHSAASAVVHS